MFELTKADFEKLKTRGLSYRETPLVGSTFNETDNSIDTIIATENPVIVYDWENSSWTELKLMREILIIDEKSVVFPKNNQVPLLDSHQSWEGTKSVKGSIRDLRIENSKVVGKTFVSSVENELATKIKEGHLCNTSAGYTVYKNKSYRLKPGESKIIKGREYKNDFGDDLDLMIRLKWSLNEGSVVVWGADQFSSFREEPADYVPEDVDKNKYFLFNNNNPRRTKMDEKQIQALIEQKVNEAKEQVRNENKEAATEAIRVANIYSIAGDFQRNLPGIDLIAKAKEYADGKKTSEEFRTYVMAEFKNPEAIRKPNSELGLTNDEVNKFSMREIVLAAATGSVDKLGVVYEASRELAQRFGKTQDKNNIHLPFEFQKKRITSKGLTPEMVRELTVSPDSAGGYTVQYQYIEKSFIEYLYASNPLTALGVQNVEGLQGNIPMTRELTVPTFYMVAEGAPVTESSPTFGQDVMSPKTGGQLINLSHKFLTQNSVGGEEYANRKIALGIGLGVAYYALYGTGTTQPVGLKNITGIGGVEGSGFTRAKALSMLSQIKTSNATQLGVPQWLSNSEVASLLYNVDTTTGYGKWLLDDVTNKMTGYNFAESNIIEDKDLFVGIWNSLIIGYWNAIEIVANPYGSGFASGQIQVRGLVDFDVFAEYPTAFALAEDVSA